MERSPEELKKELLRYEAAFLKIDDAIIELKQKVGLAAPEMTIGLKFCEVGSGF